MSIIICLIFISYCFFEIPDEWNEDEWEWEEEEEEEEAPKDEEGKAHITISENLVTIDRSKVDWSDDEFEEEDEAPSTIPPPPPPPAIPVPPPPPPGISPGFEIYHHQNTSI